jgi:hypothetical protein
MESSPNLESILDLLTEINVQLRQVLHISQAVIGKLETGSHDPNPIEEFELETRSQSILRNMARTEEAIRNLNQEITVLLGPSRFANRVSAKF